MAVTCTLLLTGCAPESSAIGVAAGTTVPTTPSSTGEASVGAPSQSASDAKRDHVIPELAAFPLGMRVSPLVEVDTEEGRKRERGPWGDQQKSW